jgi:hypothetical protein
MSTSTKSMSRYVDKYGRPYPDDAFENDVGHYDGPRHMDLEKVTAEIEERFKKIQVETRRRASRAREGA